MVDKPICQVQKNAREAIQFRIGTYRKYCFGDMRIFIIEEGKDPVPTAKGLSVSPALWPQFKASLALLEEAMIKEGLLDREDLEIES